MRVLILLSFTVLKCFSLPPSNIGNQRMKQIVQDDTDIPVAYLAGNDCTQCLTGAGNTVGMLRFDTNQWCFGAPTVFNITQQNTVYTGGVGYIISGYGSLNGQPIAAKYLTSVNIYNPTNDTYYSAPSVRYGRQQFSSVVNGGKIYVVDGYTRNQAESNTMEIFDGYSWAMGPDTITTRAAHVVVTWGNYLWLIGGLLAQSPFPYLNTVEYLNLNSISDGWQQGPTLNKLRGFLGATVINNVIYACGGYNNGENFADCETLNININGGPQTGQAWVTSLSVMQNARADFTLVAYNNKAYTIGGYWFNGGSPTTTATTVEEYDPVSDAWTVFYQAPASGPFPNNCLGCRATLMYVSETDMLC